MKRTLVLVAFLLAITAGAAAQYVGYDGHGEYAGYGSAAVSAGYVEKTYMFVYDASVVGHYDSAYDIAIAGADSIIDLSDATNDFAFAMIDTAAPAAEIGALIGGATNRRLRVQGSTETTDDMNLALGTGRNNTLLYIPFERFIPAGSQIVSAKKRAQILSSFASTVNDSFISVLMTSASDSLWHQSVGVTSPNQPRAAHASHRYQILGTGTNGYPASNGGDWVPEVNARTRWWAWGNYADMTGKSNGLTISGGQFLSIGFDIDLTNCVQAAVNGETNNGIMIAHMAPITSGSDLLEASWFAPSYEKTTPWIEVKFLTRKYVAPWPNGGEVAYVFVVDDGRKNINAAAVAEFTSHGGKYTSYLVGKRLRLSDTDATYATITQNIADYNSGVVEIGQHSYFHGHGLDKYDVTWPDDPLGAATEYTPAMYPTLLTASATAIDSLLYEADKEPWYYEFEVETGTSWRDKPLFVKSFGHPVTMPSPEAFNSIVFNDYVGARMPIVNRNKFDADGNFDGYATPSSARGDTIYPWLRPNHMGEPRNLAFIGMTHQVTEFVGTKVSNPTEAEIKYLFRMEFEKARANKRRVVSFFTHDIKSPSISAYASGIDQDELGWSLDALDETTNGVSMSVAEVTGRLKLFSTPMATPPAYAQPDTFEFTVDDAVWGQLDGIDNTFIPGVK